MVNPVTAYRRFLTRGLSPLDRVEANLDVAVWNVVFIGACTLVTLGLLMSRAF